MNKEKSQAIVVLGRGIGLNSSGNWQPTHYFETLEQSGHSGRLESHPDPTNPATVIAGGNANTLATYHLYKDLADIAHPPKLIIFAAGRPKYLQNEPKEISEGAVMNKKIKRLLDYKGLDLPEAIILTENRNTKDDVLESIKILKERGISRAYLVTLRVHMPRTKEFIKLAEKEFGDDIDSIKINCIASEDILAQVDKRYTSFFNEALLSAPFRRTSEMEQWGLKALNPGLDTSK